MGHKKEPRTFCSTPRFSTTYSTNKKAHDITASVPSFSCVVIEIVEFQCTQYRK